VVLAVRCGELLAHHPDTTQIFQINEMSCFWYIMQLSTTGCCCSVINGHHATHLAGSRCQTLGPMSPALH